jgi:hypothetical protein
VFILDKAHEQSLPPYQHTVCAPIWNVLHIVSSILQCGLQRNDLYSTENQRLVPRPLQLHRQREELKFSFRIRWSVRRSWIPANLLFCLSEGPKEHSTHSLCFGFSGLFDFLFWVASTIICKVNSLFALLFHHEDLSLGSGLAQG